jgi:transcriptional regulator with XRE-family HTH domain
MLILPSLLNLSSKNIACLIYLAKWAIFELPRRQTMEKKPKSRSTAPEPTARQTLGDYLANIRAIRKLTLREVEEATGKEVSNAYLSQLETNKIQKPSPNVLHALATVYSVPYETLMEKAGYLTPTPASTPALRSAGGARHGRVATFANENLTKEEEESLLEYLAFMRSRRGKSDKT